LRAMDLSKDFNEFIGLLNENEVEYLLVGGYAVILHGYPRFTGDIDFFIRRTSQNAEKVIQVLREFGFSELDISADDLIKPDQILQLGRHPLRIDILTSLEGVTFQECIKEKEIFEVDNLTLPVIGLKQLKKNKKAAGRTKDLNDLENL